MLQNLVTIWAVIEKNRTNIGIFFTELKNGSDFTEKTMSGDGQFYAPAYNLVI